MNHIRKYKLYFRIGAALITLGAVVFVVSFFILPYEKEEPKATVSDKEIAERAKEMGMVYPSDHVPDAALPSGTTPTDVSEPLTDDEIIKRAEELGMTLPQPTPTEAPAAVDAVHISIPRGLNASEVAKRLQEAGIVDDASKFAKFVTEADVSKNINSGEYDIKKGLEYAEVLSIISKKYKR